jgi:hypothetical protein
MLLVERISTFSELGNKPHEIMSFSVLRIGSRALQHWLSKMYSASVELSAISVCSLLYQCIGTPSKRMIQPVRDKHESRSRQIIGAIRQQSHCCSMRQVLGFYSVS